jgi:two-component system, cell cycle sensor histidine kinase and response regulator CckA
MEEYISVTKEPTMEELKQRIRALEEESIKGKQAEEALRESERRLRTILESVQAGIVIIDADTHTIVDVNKIAADLIGNPKEMIIGSICHSYICPAEKDKCPVTDLGNTIDNSERVLLCTDGTRMPILKTVSTITLGGRKQLLESFVNIADRKQAEQAMRESETRFHELFSNMTSGVALYEAKNDGADFLLKDINNAGMLITGMKREDVVGKLVTDAFPGIREMGLLEVFSRVWRTGIAEHQSTAYYADVHLSRWFENNVYKLPSGEIVAVYDDITERKQTENALRQSEEKYRNILESIEDGYWETDLTGTFTFVSDAMCRFVGIPEEQLLGINSRSYTSEGEAARLYQIFMGIYKTGEPAKDFAFEFTGRDGTKSFAEVTVSLMRDSAGKKIGFRGLSRDVTERKKAEEQLRESEEKYRNILESINDGYFEQDLAGNFIFLNEAMYHIYGYPKEELMGMNYKRNTDKKSGKKCFQAYVNIYRTGKPGKVIDFEIIRKDGTRRHVESSVSLKKDSAGNPAAFRGIVRDVTDREQAEEEKRILEERLNRAEKMEALGQMAGGVAHDLNNVLGVLVGYSELLARTLPENSSPRLYADNIMQSSLRGAAIVQDLLTLARRGVTISEVVNLNEVVLNYLRTPEFEKLKSYHSGVKIRTELKQGLVNIKGSPIHLGKTIMNLVSNAAEAISGRGEVMLRTENRYLNQPIHGYDYIEEGDYVVLSVSDTGSGISANDLGKIFEPFYTKKVMGRSGTGLGLAVVWGTVKDHNAYIDVQSKEGEGSIFTLYFPVTREEQPIAEKAISPLSYMGKGESILVVDDIEEQRELAMSLLGRLGYQVDAVASGEDAIEYLKNKEANLVVLDMIMDPGIDGMETYRRILEINPGQKAIIVSGFSETDRVKRVQKMGASTFVQKPYILEKIGVAVRKEIDRK